MKYDAEIEAVKELGERIGYGNMMGIASALWARMLNDYDGNGISIGAHVSVPFCAVNDFWWKLVKDSTLRHYKRVDEYFNAENSGEDNHDTQAG